MIKDTFWLSRESGTMEGPITKAALWKALKKGQIKPEQKVCADGGHEWVNVGSLLRRNLAVRRLGYFSSLIIGLILLFYLEPKSSPQRAEILEGSSASDTSNNVNPMVPNERENWAAEPSERGEVKMVSRYLKGIARDADNLQFISWENLAELDVLKTTVDFTSNNGSENPPKETWIFKINRKQGYFLQIYNTAGQTVFRSE